METVFLPYANSHLSKGFPLPIIHGLTLQDAEIILSTSRVTVCSDVSFAESNKLFFKSSNLLSRYSVLLMHHCKYLNLEI